MRVGLHLFTVASAAALSLVLPSLAAAAPASVPMTSGFEPAQVIELVKRELVAVDRQLPASGPALRVDEAQIELDLVEVSAKGGSRLVVPAAEFAAAREDARRGGPKRRLVVDLTPVREKAKSTDGESVANDAAAGGGALARAISELTGNMRGVLDAPPQWEARRVSIDLDFAVERDAHGAPALVVFTAGRSADARDLHRLKLRLAGRDADAGRAASRSASAL